MTLFHLVRHGEHELQGRALVGRMPGIMLSAKGRDQAGRLAARLADESVAAVLSSPRERARDTARPIADRHGRAVVTDDALDEIDYGAWTGKSAAALEPDPAFRRFNSFRSFTPPPGGEWIVDVQRRVIGLMRRLVRDHRDDTVVLVSHGDVIRGALVHHLGAPIDFIHRIEVAPGSLSTVVIGDESACVTLLGEMPR
jgi:probable phosphoglycerate mutase